MKSNPGSVRTFALCFVLAVSIHFSAKAVAAQEKSAPESSVSQQDKLKECNNLADKKNLTGEDRKNFLKSCAEKATGTQPVSEKDKMNACKNLADKKNLNLNPAPEAIDFIQKRFGDLNDRK
jgi:LAS superfamily LD-carboxypeptidase LdcB